MKLCIIADGRSTHTQRWAAYFGTNHDVHLITYEPSGVRIDGVTEHVLPSITGNLYLSFWPRHLRLLRLVRNIRPDLIHAHFIAKYGFHIPFLGVHPSIVSAWGDDVLILPRRSALIRFFTGLVLRNVDRIYAISEDIARHIRDDFSISPARITHIPIGIDCSVFSPEHTAKDPKKSTIEFFSNRGYYPVYDTETLVRGFARAYRENPSLRLSLKGNGPVETAVRALVESLGIGTAVTFRGRTSFEEVPRDYRKADVFVTTSVSDGTPVSVLEAMATGLPCIATRVGGIPEWITDGVNGILIPPRSPEMLAETMLKLAADAQLRETLGANARLTIIKRGEWTTLMAAVEKDYQELIRTYSRKRP
jgi:glycosyltransferase involved in cell wall biosynthesis